MKNVTEAHRLALLAAALALAGPGPALAQTLTPERLVGLTDLADIEAVLGDGSVRQILGNPDLAEAFFDRFTLLEISHAGVGDTGPQAEIRFFAVENNTSLADGIRLDRRLEAVLCDGSVRLAGLGAGACDDRVTPVPMLETLSIQGTLNPSIVMAGTYNDYSLNGDPFFGVVATTGLGIPGFEPGSWLEGLFELTSIFPNQLYRGAEGFFVDGPFDPILDVTVRDPTLRDYYIFGMVDLGLFPDPDDAILRRTVSGDTPIAQGEHRTDFVSLPSAPFQCITCTTGSAGVGFVSPGRGGDESVNFSGTRTEFAVTFRVREAPPTVIPLPAAGWLLLAGIGALAALGRRRAA